LLAALILYIATRTKPNDMKKLLLLINACLAISFANAQCLPPINIVTYPGQISVEVHFAPVVVADYFDLYICPAGSPAPQSFYPPTISTSGFNGQINCPGLNCNSAYDVYVRSVCDGNVTGDWSAPHGFYTEACTTFYYPQNLSACPVNGESCFDLHQNDDIIVGGSFPDGWFDIHYYGSYEDFGNLTNEIDSACISSGSQTIYGYVVDNYTQGSADFQFQITAQENNCNGMLLNAFLDSNNNGVKDSGEHDFPFGQFSFQRNDDDQHVVSSPTGIYKISENNETNTYDLGFSINPQQAPYYSIPTPSYSSVHAPEVGFETYNFPIVSLSTYHDAAVSMSTYDHPAPGNDYRIYVRYTNLGNQPESGTVTFTKDPALLYMSATPSQGGTVSATGTGLTYDFANLAPLQTAIIIVHLQVPTLPTVSLGQWVECSASVAIPNSISESISAILTGQIRAAYDPNDKMEAHGPEINVDSFTADDYLTYTIRFENTGNADALNIKVTDVLSDQLDASTVRMVSSSHDVIMDRVGSNIIWRFNGINLPPVSETDPMLGHGYLTFEVKPIAGFEVGDVIANEASIYFDLNPAIVTNLFETHFVETLGVNAFENQQFAIYPNPVNDKLTVVSDGFMIQSVAIFDVSGKQVQSNQFRKLSSAVLDVGGLQSGMYFVKVTTDSGLTSTKKLIKK
jgi:uncharacterized repeat protein (TIGR01451 family)